MYSDSLYGFCLTVVFLADFWMCKYLPETSDFTCLGILLLLLIILIMFSTFSKSKFWWNINSNLTLIIVCISNRDYWYGFFNVTGHLHFFLSYSHIPKKLFCVEYLGLVYICSYFIYDFSSILHFSQISDLIFSMKVRKNMSPTSQTESLGGSSLIFWD